MGPETRNIFFCFGDATFGGDMASQSCRAPLYFYGAAVRFRYYDNLQCTDLHDFSGNNHYRPTKSG